VIVWYFLRRITTNDLSLKGYPMKRFQSWGITNLMTQPQELGLYQKPPNPRAFHGFWGVRSPRKEAQDPHVWLPQQIPLRHLQNLPAKIHQKGFKNHRKRKTGSTSKSQGGTRINSKPSIHEEKIFFAKRLATSHHPTHLKILEALASPRKEEERGKTKEQMN
jgi:hypothetical protein